MIVPIVFHILVFNSISGIDIQSIGKTHYIIHVTPISSFRVLYSQTWLWGCRRQGPAHFSRAMGCSSLWISNSIYTCLTSTYVVANVLQGKESRMVSQHQRSLTMSQTILAPSNLPRTQPRPTEYCPYSLVLWYPSPSCFRFRVWRGSGTFVQKIT